MAMGLMVEPMEPAAAPAAAAAPMKELGWPRKPLGLKPAEAAEAAEPKKLLVYGLAYLAAMSLA